MWHQFSLHALTYCRLCKDVERRNGSRLCYQSFDCFMVGRSRRCACAWNLEAPIARAAPGCPASAQRLPMTPELRLLYGRKVRLLYGLGLKIEPRVHGSKKRAGRTQARVPLRPSVLIIRSYQGESTGSHPNSEVKHLWACSVLRWGTTWESQVTYVLPVRLPPTRALYRYQ